MASKGFSVVWGEGYRWCEVCVFLCTPCITGKAAVCFCGLWAALPQSLEGVSHWVHVGLVVYRNALPYVLLSYCFFVLNQQCREHLLIKSYPGLLFTDCCYCLVLLTVGLGERPFTCQSVVAIDNFSEIEIHVAKCSKRRLPKRKYLKSRSGHKWSVKFTFFWNR